MKYIGRDCDTILNLEVKDTHGHIIPLYERDVCPYVEVTISTKGTKDYYIHRATTTGFDFKDNHIPISYTELEQLNRGQLIIKLFVEFRCDEMVETDNIFSYSTTINTNIILND